MKWLSAGLTLVNVATVSGLLLGMAAGGLNRAVAVLSICLGCILGVFAYLGTIASRARTKKVALTPPARESKRSQRKRKGLASHISQPVERSYESIWLWLVAACFAIFAVRS